MTETQNKKNPASPFTRSTREEKYIRKVTWVGLALNLLLSAFKFFAGIVGASQTMVADAIHSLSDSVTDVAVLIGSHYWSMPPDETHPYGHRRIETLVTIFIGGALLLAGVEIAREAMLNLSQKHATPPGGIALTAAGISVVCKELLYRWTALAGKRVRSSALAANAWHHRLDAISSVPALFAVGGAILIPRWAFLDGLGALAVSGLIIHAAVKIIRPGIREFTDAGAPEHIRDEITRIALKENGVRGVHALRTRYIGMSLQVDLHVVVDRSMTVLEGHEVAEAVTASIINEGPDVIDVLVHIEPDNY